MSTKDWYWAGLWAEPVVGGRSKSWRLEMTGVCSAKSHLTSSTLSVQRCVCVGVGVGVSMSVCVYIHVYA